MENNDDGSLGFLNIQPDEDRKYFHCEEITQQKLLNKSFWVIDFIGNQLSHSTSLQLLSEH